MNDILTTVISISAISGTLALLLSIANRTIANYGDKKMLINNEKELIVDGGDTLLSSLIENEIFIPSACGGKGSCGYCKVKVLEGGGEVLPTELGYLTKEDQDGGVRLSCQCKVKEDISIEIPEELFNVKQYDYTVKQNNLVNSTIKHLVLDLPAGKEIDFKPGQYIQILTPTYKGNDEEVYRAYSLASPPSQKHTIELFIGLIPEGICTTYVHTLLKEGQKLTVVGPFGDFYYRESEREMVMVAIGTGMAPIMSILRHMHENKIHRKCTFFFSARNKQELYMMDKIAEFEKDMPNFKFIYSLTRATDEDQWEGDKVRVPDLIKKYLENGANKEAYMCGSPKMIDSAAEALVEIGMEEAFIYYDKFE
ncbi:MULTISPECIES: NADH:ubiquinone reductase (Na(+)-transporting) subunit F [unclassified Fusibacter]|uniref:NADH:ubiquinone reductase (Na(+)-transporting) subunit F n=1 Tax=unclassified Fusibacter TaxID=2624464 RepID=UPI0010103667|nr:MULTISPECIES: 2Fe-2S iron-sulfur cluster binding domain-containing protein [unclassified Fusibacter]MCK8059815.1 FAD-binding oxidoreductase [Fusibacter sp. A2]NPE21616.1 2Fe-2S iron-sulfur cluster binding domain-containing protein [Fusibacter sp. A1]RXV62022.1 oxidoreductase [Fusibacter sp. A1]